MNWLNLDKSSKKPLIRQLYEGISKRVLKGELPAGYKLPSSRELAASLGVSRNVVLEAYEILSAEGYVKGVHGSGMYVAENACFEEAGEQELLKKSESNTACKTKPDLISFRSGLPALDLFPVRKWSSLFNNICLNLPSEELGYGDPAGCEELRLALAGYLFKVRGVSCKPENIVVTTGAVQALQLCAKLLTSKGDEILLEDPSNYDLQRILSSNGAELNPVAADENGMDTKLLPEDKNPRFIYITPSHQFPLGGILPIQRRIELIKYAQKKNCYIIEDDYDSEYRYEGPPVSSLQSLEPERVIYIGTFSKTMFPALRIGYIVLPDVLVKDFRKLKRHADFQTPILEQLTLAAFIEGGLLQRHISKMKKVYFRKQQQLLHYLDKWFAGQYRVYGKSTGLHVVVEFSFGVTHTMQQNLKKHNVRIIPVKIHSMNKCSQHNRYIVGYGHLSEKEICEGVKRIHAAFKE